MANILAVDDEKGILFIIKSALEKDGHKVDCAYEPSALKINDLNKYDLILLDVMMPDIDGFTFCKEIRSFTDCPIIFITAKTMENDVIKGLSIGGDDYILKPFKIGELRARVMAHLRREKRTKQNAFIINDIKFNMLSKEAFYDEEKIPFTKSEYAICEFLALNHGIVFSKETIVEKVFGFDNESDESAIVEHIKNIRSKLLKYDLKPIETVWGIGYKWA